MYVYDTDIILLQCYLRAANFKPSNSYNVFKLILNKDRFLRAQNRSSSFNLVYLYIFVPYIG